MFNNSSRDKLLLRGQGPRLWVGGHHSKLMGLGKKRQRVREGKEETRVAAGEKKDRPTKGSILTTGGSVEMV